MPCLCCAIYLTRRNATRVPSCTLPSLTRLRPMTGWTGMRCGAFCACTRYPPKLLSFWRICTSGRWLRLGWGGTWDRSSWWAARCARVALWRPCCSMYFWTLWWSRPWQACHRIMGRQCNSGPTATCFSRHPRKRTLRWRKLHCCSMQMTWCFFLLTSATWCWCCSAWMPLQSGLPWGLMLRRPRWCRWARASRGCRPSSPLVGAQ